MLLPVDIDAYFIKGVTDVTYINSCLIKLRHANWKVHKQFMLFISSYVSILVRGQTTYSTYICSVINAMKL